MKKKSKKLIKKVNVMNKEALITHFVMFILGCITMYMMVNYL